MIPNRLTTTLDRFNRWEATYQSTVNHISEGDAKLDLLRRDAVLDRRVAEVFNTVTEVLRREDETRLAAIVTHALRDVFFDQTLTLKANPATYRRQTALDLTLVDEVQGVEGDPLDSFGGGPVSVLGLLLQVAAILRRPDLARILILDEPLTAVSPEYQEGVGRLLKRICRELGFSMLVVSHAESLAQAADHCYVARGTPEGVLLDEAVRDSKPFP